MLKRLRTLFFILAIFLIGTINSAYSKTIKFVQITDSHYMLTPEGKEDASHAVSILDSAIKDINRIKDVKFVVFTGDNIDKPSPELLYMFLKEANKLTVPYYLAIGDHELFKSQNFTRKDYMYVTRHISKHCHPLKSNYIFKNSGIVFIVLDGAKEVIPGTNGYYRLSTLQWLDKKLKKYENKKVVIVQHFPVVPPIDKKSYETYNVKNYEDVLALHKNVIAIISGHYHVNNEQYKDGIYHISSPALIDEPHSFKVIEIETKAGSAPQIYTQLRNAE